MPREDIYVFRCQLSGQISQPREKAIRVIVKERPKTYEVFKHDERGEEYRAQASGSEIEQEVVVRLSSIDPERAARLASRTPPDVEKLKAEAASRQEHAKKCKKSLDDCWICQRNVEFFASLPLNVLTLVTEEKRFR